MSDYLRRNTRWRDLDLAQMHLWSNAPRRWTVAFLAVLLLGLCVFYFILPRYERLAEEQKQVLNTQNQIILGRYTADSSD
jgi:membrane protein implicated in regulation of membrane protease activity